MLVSHTIHEFLNKLKRKRYHVNCKSKYSAHTFIQCLFVFLQKLSLKSNFTSALGLAAILSTNLLSTGDAMSLQFEAIQLASINLPSDDSREIELAETQVNQLLSPLIDTK